MTDSKLVQWRDALELALKATDEAALIFDYWKVAMAFPSPHPHPRTFEHRIIDDVSLRKWGATLGWRVDLVSEGLAENSDLFPQVRFYKASQ